MLALMVSITVLDQAFAATEPQRAGGGGSGARLLSASAAPTGVYQLPAAVPYSDCSGASPLARTVIYRDTCLPGIYLLAHNPGLFTPVLALNVGSRVAYESHVYSVRSVSLTTAEAQWRDAHLHPALLTLQTCTGGQGSAVLVIRAS